jgi:hypothetical protein
MIFKFRGKPMSKSNKLLTQVGSVAALCFMFIAFQNCGKQMHFSSTDVESSLKDSNVVTIPTNENEDGDVDIDNNDGDTNVQPPTDVDETPVVHGNSDGDKNVEHGHETVDVPTTPVIEETDDSTGAEKIDSICILVRHGGSGKLNLALENGNTRAVESICMTENACNNIVSQKFSVVGPAFRGYCVNGGASSVSLTDAQVQEAINKVP